MRVIILLATIALAGCSSKVDQSKFENLYRAGKNVEGALDVGVNLLRYRELVQSFSTEVSIANDRAGGSSERELVKTYNTALAAFKDAETLWGKKLNAQDGTLTCTDAEVRRVAGDYPISGTGSGSGFTFKIDDAVQTIWRQARGNLSQATTLYRGERSPDLPEVQRP